MIIAVTDAGTTMELVTVLIATTVETAATAAAEIQATAQGEIIAEKMDFLANLVMPPRPLIMLRWYR